MEWPLRHADAFERLGLTPPRCGQGGTAPLPPALLRFRANQLTRPASPAAAEACCCTGRPAAARPRWCVLRPPPAAPPSSHSQVLTGGLQLAVEGHALGGDSALPSSHRRLTLVTPRAPLSRPPPASLRPLAQARSCTACMWGRARRSCATPSAAPASSPLPSSSWTSSTRSWVRCAGCLRCRGSPPAGAAARPAWLWSPACAGLGGPSKPYPRLRRPRRPAGKRVEGEQTGEVTARILSSFLTEMDGLELATGVLVMGATNRPQALDVALIRRGGRAGLPRHALCGTPPCLGRSAPLTLPRLPPRMSPSSPQARPLRPGAVCAAAGRGRPAAGAEHPLPPHPAGAGRRPGGGGGPDGAVHRWGRWRWEPRAPTASPTNPSSTQQAVQGAGVSLYMKEPMFASRLCVQAPSWPRCAEKRRWRRCERTCRAVRGAGLGAPLSACCLLLVTLADPRACIASLLCCLQRRWCASATLKARSPASSRS